MKTLLILSLVSALIAVAAIGPRQVLAAVLSPIESYVQSVFVFGIMHRDLHNNVSVVQALNSALTTATTDTAGSAVDRKGFDSVELIAQTGAVTTTTASIAMRVQESDTSTASDFADAAAGSLLGTAAGFSFTAGATSIANAVRRIGYNGTKRYVRAVRTGAASATGVVGAVAVLGLAENAPVS